MGKRDPRNEVDTRQFHSKRNCRHCKSDFTIVNPAQVYCKICCPTGIAYQRLKLYNLSHPEFQAMWDHQNGLCGLCDVPLIDHGCSGMNIDHCHIDGHIRGLVCHHCNILLGLVDKGNWPRRLTRIADYLTGNNNLRSNQKYNEFEIAYRKIVDAGL